MWPRAVEIVIGLWVLMSPWLLASNSSASTWHLNELICGLAIVLLSASSYLPGFSKAHLAEIPIGLWILISSYFGFAPIDTVQAQSNLLAALFLLNFAIIPSPANLPPYSWRSWDHASTDGKG